MGSQMRTYTLVTDGGVRIETRLRASSERAAIARAIGLLRSSVHEDRLTSTTHLSAVLEWRTREPGQGQGFRAHCAQIQVAVHPDRTCGDGTRPHLWVSIDRNATYWRERCKRCLLARRVYAYHPDTGEARTHMVLEVPQ